MYSTSKHFWRPLYQWNIEFQVVVYFEMTFHVRMHVSKIQHVYGNILFLMQRHLTILAPNLIFNILYLHATINMNVVNGFHTQ
jgi:hypothetical protein